MTPNHLLEKYPDGIFPVLEVSKVIGQDPSNVRRKAARLNGVINFNSEDDTLSTGQLKSFLPTYLNGQRQLRGDNREAVKKFLNVLDGNVEVEPSKVGHPVKDPVNNRQKSSQPAQVNTVNEGTTDLNSIGYKVRTVLPILPLPMLGLAASYGVFHFANHFVPTWIAVVEACGFEMVYVGLAASLTLPPSVRKYAKTVSWGAVITSVVYNVLAGALALNPQLFDGMTQVWFWVVSVIHGTPLAVLAFFVADLNLHKRK